MPKLSCAERFQVEKFWEINPQDVTDYEQALVYVMFRSFDLLKVCHHMLDRGDRYKIKYLFINAN